MVCCECYVRNLELEILVMIQYLLVLLIVVDATAILVAREHSKLSCIKITVFSI